MNISDKHRDMQADMMADFFDQLGIKTEMLAFGRQVTFRTDKAKRAAARFGISHKKIDSLLLGSSGLTIFSALKLAGVALGHKNFRLSLRVELLPEENDGKGE
jgi:hypothetical protein